MATLVFDQILARRLVDERRAAGTDRFDEVWEGTYVMAPLADDEHQDVQAGLVMVLRLLLGTGGGKSRVRAGVNVTDRDESWRENYRCPDVVVFNEGTTAENHGTYWL